MAQNSFEELYPDYKIIPLKQSKWKGPLVVVGSILAMAALTYGMFKELGRLQVPIANMAGVNANTVNTLKNLALTQAKNGDYKAAMKSFDDYFKLGGADPVAKRTADSVRRQVQGK